MTTQLQPSMAELNEQNAFQIAETKERNILRALFEAKGITNYEFSPLDSNLRWDFKFEKDGIKYVGDIKCRNIPSTLYPDSLIDKSKIDFLLELGVEESARPLILVHYTDGVICSWDLERQRNNIKVETKYCNRTSAINTGKKEKKVCLLLTKSAVKHKI